MSRRLLLIGGALALLLVAPAAALAEAPQVATYEVTITNHTTGQWFTPAVVATHRRGFDAFDVGRSVSFEVKEIAENGNIDPLVSAAQASRAVWDTKVVLGVSGPPPIAPGSSVTFEITAARGAQRISWVSMLICTNDGFTGLDSVRLPSRVGESATFDTNAYDAGSEINTEAWEDLVPPCAMLTGFGDQGGTAVSNPALAENGVIAMHPGIAGVADLVRRHAWINPVATVEVTRTK